ncbi:MAG TPA: phosphate ABC transporter ATP-binding protein [Anaerolineae bacterium]|nr:phosphate ABC transporter ATP-binding protein [Anaerolineae bacterium]
MAPVAFSIETRDLNLWYGTFQALKNVSMSVRHGQIMGLIGPSGCGKTTLLRCFNRINERYGYVRTTGEIEVLGQNVHAPDVSLVELRKSVGMVFQRPNPLPLSVRENVVFGIRVHTERREQKKSSLDEAVEKALREVGLWDDLKDRLNARATSLQLEQQQKLCIARLLPLKPEVILMDEPCSALDPVATLKIEELMQDLKSTYTIVIVTHNMQQAARVSDYTAMMMMRPDRAGEMIEFDVTQKIFTRPKDKRTEDYVTGRFG